MFRRPTARYVPTPQPETPYQRARQASDERICSAPVPAHKLRLPLFAAPSLSGGLGHGPLWDSAAADRRRATAQESPRHLRPRLQLVQGARLMRILFLAVPLLASVSLAACSRAWKPPEIKYDDTPRQAVLQADPPKPIKIVEVPKPLPLPGQLKPPPGPKAPTDPADPHVRAESANGAARVQRTRAGYINGM